MRNHISLECRASRPHGPRARLTRFQWWPAMAAICVFCAISEKARAQSPELSMRDFSSGQIKKGSRSIGFGGDGATWGNYSLVWKDASTGLVDYADTHYSNGNDFHFTAAGVTTPPLWHEMAVYVVAMSQDTNNVHFNTKSPGLGAGPVPVVGKGNDDAVFLKAAMPLGNGWSAGIMLAHETSNFNATAVNALNQNVRYETAWRPSGGFGVSWQPEKTSSLFGWIFGFRAILNDDHERRIDPLGVTEGAATSSEYRLGASYSPWQGALIDVGGTRLERHDDINATHSVNYRPNLGFEQQLFDGRLALRGGLDETSPTAGLTFKFAPFRLDVAYVYDMALGRVGNLFGTHSNSVFFALTLDYGPGSPPPSSPMQMLARRGTDTFGTTTR